MCIHVQLRGVAKKCPWDPKAEAPDPVTGGWHLLVPGEPSNRQAPGAGVCVCGYWEEVPEKSELWLPQWTGGKKGRTVAEGQTWSSVLCPPHVTAPSSLSPPVRYNQHLWERLSSWGWFFLLQ